MSPTAKIALVVDDDDTSRFVFREVLERDGFDVLESALLTDAIEICRSHPDRIALLVSDIVLRGESGPTAVRQIRELQPGIAVVLVSGYPLELLKNRGMVDTATVPGARIDFLQKPFTTQALLQVVHDLIV